MKKSKITSAKILKVNYNGPAALKSGNHNMEYILSNLAVGQIFERSDKTKIIITSLTEKSLVVNVLDFHGKPLTETRCFGKEIFAGLIRTKHFEPTTIARRETYAELIRTFDLDKNVPKTSETFKRVRTPF